MSKDDTNNNLPEIVTLHDLRKIRFRRLPSRALNDLRVTGIGHANRRWTLALSKRGTIYTDYSGIETMQITVRNNRSIWPQVVDGLVRLGVVTQKIADEFRAESERYAEARNKVTTARDLKTNLVNVGIELTKWQQARLGRFESENTMLAREARDKV